MAKRNCHCCFIEQCGRNVVPQIRPVMNLANWCAEKDQSVKLNLHQEQHILFVHCLQSHLSQFVY